MPKARYARGKYKVYQLSHENRYNIRDGKFIVATEPLRTLGEAKQAVDDLCRCKVCDGDKITICRDCGGACQAVNGLPCVPCLATGFTKCRRCGGSGEEPE